MYYSSHCLRVLMYINLMFGGGFETVVENELDIINNLFCIKRIRCEINRHVLARDVDIIL